MEDGRTKIPIVFSFKYNISFFGLENVLHSFDSKKYGKVFNYVSNHFKFRLTDCFEPKPITKDQLLSIHTSGYLESLNSSYTAAKIAEVPLLAIVPNFLVQSRLLEPMRLATSGTVQAAHLALKYGWAINLSGGYHHAKVDSGSGFCFYADIPLAIDTLFREHNDCVSRVLVIDLDAHQGNGFQAVHTVRDFNETTAPTGLKRELSYRVDDRVTLLDMYNNDIYPSDRAAQVFVNYKVPLHSGTTDELYLSQLKKHLEAALDRSRPDVVFYNAGTDIYREDPLGRLGVSEEGIVARDEHVFRTCCLERGIPVVMTLSGGYSSASAGIIGRSLVNLFAKGVLQLRPLLER